MPCAPDPAVEAVGRASSSLIRWARSEWRRSRVLVQLCALFSIHFACHFFFVHCIATTSVRGEGFRLFVFEPCFCLSFHFFLQHALHCLLAFGPLFLTVRLASFFLLLFFSHISYFGFIFMLLCFYGLCFCGTAS